MIYVPKDKAEFNRDNCNIFWDFSSSPTNSQTLHQELFVPE
jgi:hypothetical protein